MRTNPGKEDAGMACRREVGTVAVPKGIEGEHAGIRAFVKAWIVRLALWGWRPYGLANWLIQRGGLRHD
jgi:hypothetical protein